MRLKILLYAVFVAAMFGAVSAQTAVITPKKTTYHRKVDKNFEHKKTFTVTRPIVSGLSAALNRKIEKMVSFENNFDFNLQQEIKEIFWLEEADYKINYNRNNILDINLIIIGSGAYPSEAQKTVVVDLRSGERVTANEVFTKLGELTARIKKMQQAEMRKAAADYKKDSNSADFDAQYYFKDAAYTIKNLNDFTVSQRGVTFQYDYGFPHVVLALEPEGRFFLSWTQLKPFIKPSGLLAKFVR